MDEHQLYEHHHLVVDQGQAPMRMDKYVQMRLSSVSRNKVQAAALIGCIRVNGVAAKASYQIKPGDEISILLPEPPHETDILPEDLPLHIVYEDDDLIVVDKEAGMVVHPAHGNWSGTLVNGLLHYLSVDAITGEEAAQTLGSPDDDADDPMPNTEYQELKAVAHPKPLTHDPNHPYPYLVHRIDKDTTGLLVVTKNEQTQAALAKQFFYHTIQRKYLALVWGSFNQESGTIEGNLERAPYDRRVMHVTPDPERGKHAVTHWRVVEPLGYVTLIECQLETGRTHQIRAHMQHIGHPLFNDAAYGGNRVLKGTTFSRYRQFVENCFQLLPRQALHATLLGFQHPTTGQQLLFQSPLPDDMQTVLDRWRNYSTNHG